MDEPTRDALNGEAEQEAQEPTPQAQENPLAETIAEILWNRTNVKQMQELATAEESGDREPAYIAVATEIAQKAQKIREVQEAQEDTIRINGKPAHARNIEIDLSGYDPKLDPASPEFDKKAWREAITAAGGFEAIGKRIADKFSIFAEMEQGLMQTVIQSIGEPLQAIVETAKAALSGITKFIRSDEYKAIKASVQAFRAFIEENRAEIAELVRLAGAGEEIQTLAPFVQIELEEAKDSPEFAGCSLWDVLIDGLNDDGTPTESKYKPLIERARQRQAEHKAAEETIAEIEQAAEELPRIISNPTDKVNYPLDKPNSVIWNLITDAAQTSPNGQIRLQIDTSKKGSNQDAIILYGINFDELETGVTITKQLTPFDKRCYIAAAALYNAGNDIITATQVYYMMGNATPPNKTDVQKVNDSLTKMGAARIYIDNQQEVKATKGYTHFKYDAHLLPFERISAYINGQLTESAIHLFREPPLMAFARQRNQITTVSRLLLESPVSKTDANLRIDDYLLERIGHMKSGKGKAPRKMLFETIYRQCSITTAMQKQRAPAKIRRYLDYYKKCEWIKGYTEDADGITILL